jgi:hypothetical protein
VNQNPQQFGAKLTKRTGPFRRAVLRGLGTLLPPLLTIVILLWLGNSVSRYLLEPLEQSIRWVMVDHLADIRTPSEIITRPDGHDIAVIDGKRHKLTSRRASVTVVIGGEVFQRTPGDGKFIPLEVYETVRQTADSGSMPTDAKAIYTSYVNDQWLQPWFVVLRLSLGAVPGGQISCRRFWTILLEAIGTAYSSFTGGAQRVRLGKASD